MNKIEVYGFIFWIATYVWILLWVVWAFIPHDIIRQYLGISYFPSRYWALALPTYGMAVFVMAHALYWGMALCNTPPLNSRCLIQDNSARVAVSIEGEKDYFIPSAYDLPLACVNQKLYFENERFSKYTSTNKS
jgi:phosphatidylinositol N-acetylglucosaminyltransferase subunit P